MNQRLQEAFPPPRWCHSSHIRLGFLSLSLFCFCLVLHVWFLHILPSIRHTQSTWKWKYSKKVYSFTPSSDYRKHTVPWSHFHHAYTMSSCLFCSFVNLSDMFTVLYYMTLSLTSAILLPLFLSTLFQSGFIAVNNLMEFPTPCFHPHLAPSSSTDNPLISFPFLPACLIQLPKYFKRKCPWIIMMATSFWQLTMWQDEYELLISSSLYSMAQVLLLVLFYRTGNWSQVHSQNWEIKCYFCAWHRACVWVKIVYDCK